MYLGDMARRFAVIGFLASSVMGAALAEEGAFDAFSENVRKLNTLILDACQKDERSFLNTGGISGDLQNIYNLRRACGQGMLGKNISDSPYQVFYQFDPEAGGAVDFLGVSRKRIFGAHTYQLVFGWVTRRAEDTADAELEASFAEAILLRRSEFGWVQIWSYVVKSGDDWNRIKVEEPNDYPQFSPIEVTFIHDFWSDALVGEFPEFMEKTAELVVEK